MQYQLDDPDEYTGEEIVVIGIGDAGLENALALAVNNNVSIINRGADFPRAKAGNVALIEAAIKRGDVQHFANSETDGRSSPALLTDRDRGRRRHACRAIASSRASARSRRGVSSNPAGSQFPSAEPERLPGGVGYLRIAAGAQGSTSSARWPAIR